MCNLSQATETTAYIIPDFADLVLGMTDIQLSGAYWELLGKQKEVEADLKTVLREIGRRRKEAEK